MGLVNVSYALSLPQHFLLIDQAPYDKAYIHGMQCQCIFPLTSVFARLCELLKVTSFGMRPVMYGLGECPICSISAIALHINRPNLI